MSGDRRSSSRVDAGGPEPRDLAEEAEHRRVPGGQAEHGPHHRLHATEAVARPARGRARAARVTSSAQRSTTASSSASLDGYQ